MFQSKIHQLYNIVGYNVQNINKYILKEKFAPLHQQFKNCLDQVILWLSQTK